MDVETKKMPIGFGFPKGWTFVFDEQVVKPSYKGKDLNGLVILAPSTRQYYFLDKAISHNPTALADVDEDGVYAYLGVDKPPGGSRDEEWKAKNAAKRQNKSISCSQIRKTQSPVQQVQQHSTGINSQLKIVLKELHDKRCQDCLLCSRSDCKRCAACKENASEGVEEHQDAKKLVCYKKVRRMTWWKNHFAALKFLS